LPEIEHKDELCQMPDQFGSKIMNGGRRMVVPTGIEPVSPA
jgi:hypothetical protein